MALFRHFSCLRLTAADQCSGCASFLALKGMEDGIINLRVAKKVEGYQQRWVYMDARQTNRLLMIPTDPAEKITVWGHEKLTDPRMEPVLERMAARQAASLSGTAVVREYLRRRIAPLQQHSHPVWEYSGVDDAMRLRPGGLGSDALDGALAILLNTLSAEAPEGVLPLFRYPKKEELVKVMPLFDQ